MVPSKRKLEDDVVYTISDNEELGSEEQENDEDYEFNSDFEWADESNQFLDDEVGWGFEGAKSALNGKAQETGAAAVDLDDIVRQRREKRRKISAEEEAAKEDDESDENFGAGSDGDEEDEDEHNAASKVRKSNDIGSDAGSESAASTDTEEETKRREFFEPEPAAKPGKQSKGGSKKHTLSFQDMSLSRPILRGLTSVGYSTPTPVQARTIPVALAGRDVVVGAVTGSGKTAAFMVPILERLLHRPTRAPTTRVVVLAPTRELAMQCHAVGVRLASAHHGHDDAVTFCLAVGGLSLKVQEAELRRRPDVVVATPGRFIDLVRNSACVAVDAVEILVLDEADRMLDDGFADELNEILLLLPRSRQTMLFSATMTTKVDELVRVGLRKPVRIMVDGEEGRTASGLVQEFVRLRRGQVDRRMGYLVWLCRRVYREKAIIFFSKKVEAHRARIIFGLLGLSCAELHGSMTQAQRIESLEQFRDGRKAFLLATDLASRGLDIKGVYTVINYDAPKTLETYLHRVGRTARAGRSGTACTLITKDDLALVREIRKVAKKQNVQVVPRAVPPNEAEEMHAEVDTLQADIDEILEEEKQLKVLAQAEMEVKKTENIMIHEAEIKSRPKRTWFQSAAEKKKAARRGDKNSKDAVDKLREKLKSKSNGKLSNKDRKMLDNKADRAEGKEWHRKKTKEMRGKPAIRPKPAKKKQRGSVGKKAVGKALGKR